MATIVLQAAGAAIGGVFGPLGATLGAAVGALAGSVIDQSLFGTSTEGARLSDLDVQRSEEGAPIPRLYGRGRLSGQVIWATRFEEVTSEEGGKGGPSVTNYAYYANFAIGLCEGPVARIGRCWADGEELDLSTVTWRLSTGMEGQPADSLIEAKQGASGAPAYRGTAVVVFERLPVSDYGNRLPQMAFEVFRPISGVEEAIRAVVIIPAASEFAYDPEPVYRVETAGSRETVNRHTDGAKTDWRASLDELQEICPHLERAALAVSWFGDDLRADRCTVAPRVETASGSTSPGWSVAGLDRGTARLVNQIDGRPAFGGTPSDGSVVRAIADIKARGLGVTFYPFLMMDVPPSSGLVDPYGYGDQSAYPWRGRITASIAPGRPGTPDKTAAMTAEVAAFMGSAAPGDFSIVGGGVVYSGPPEWSYRRMVLHAAHLCVAAGGVDAFLIGSELVGLTTLRSGPSTYPFVAALRSLAADVRAVLGGTTRISYAADWSEYFGHQPGDGSGDVHFHLDPLWADANIDAVGIDLYVPLADWRDGSTHRDAEVAESGHDIAYLQANIEGGEGFNWYYASTADRAAQIRSPITDGAYGKPWVYRFKGISDWWANRHVDRPGGVEAGTPTAWIGGMKPIWFTELGCPAVDKGANEPNVFPDPKVGGARLPHFSHGGRDALMQERALSALLAYRDPAAPGFVANRNPVSPVYGGRMVDVGWSHVWAWDSRPYPAFPLLGDVWSDGGNWETGHWLNGRLGALPVSRLVGRILYDYGITGGMVGDLDGMLDGYVVERIGSARDALKPLADIFAFAVAESGAGVRFVRRGLPRLAINTDDLVEEESSALVTIRRAQETELPAELALGFYDGLSDYRSRQVTSRRLETVSRRQSSLSAAMVTDDGVAVALADARLQDIWEARETVSFALPPHALAIEAADIVSFTHEGRTRLLQVTRIEDGDMRRIETRALDPTASAQPVGSGASTPPTWRAEAGPPDVVVLDLPSLSGAEPGAAPRLAVFADPWSGPVSIAIGSAEAGYIARQRVDQRAVLGAIVAAIPPGPMARFDEATVIEVALAAGALSALPLEAVLNGGNLAAIGTEDDGFELIQFCEAVLVGAGRWRLSGLLRGQGGTGDLAARGHAAGARFVRLNAATPLFALDAGEIGLSKRLRAGPLGSPYDADQFTDRGFMVAGRGLFPLAPVHVRGRRDPTGDVALTWIRQTRQGGDRWDQLEVPLGEESEAYRVELFEAAALKAIRVVASPVALFTAGELAAVLSSPDAVFTARVCQLSPTAGAGLATEITIDV
ncbi:glycoside hydrolase/phage tail family protein [Mesorhizobium sp. BR1-1-16]|uniref:baseplate multidomain protein megatron n=1 Tax=Mesorhizobium sp. BR1-1-16 TaxID=2876653 RepID=UPI001CCE43BF|nr:glycoside hydrolase/phage tail family protein [Mesorhizobium sp. BR1-1-16]MBZ9935007.1 glycoside hydrolase/phage tail family protein [Mesorhizobium sp. BR1-1-16]